MKGSIKRLLIVVTVAVLTLTALAFSSSAKTVEGGKIDSWSIFSGTQLQSGTPNPRWQTGVVGTVSSCPRDIKLWEGENGLWLVFEYYHDPYATKRTDIRLRADKWTAIASINGGRLLPIEEYLTPSEGEDALIWDFGENYGWHSIAMKIDQDVVLENGALVYSWSVSFSVDGSPMKTYIGNPDALGIGKEVGSSPVWKLYDAALSPDGTSIDYEPASASPNSGTYLRFYFYGDSFFNSDETNKQERALIRLRNIRAYYGDSVPQVQGIRYVLNGGSLPTETINAKSDVSSASYTAESYHAKYDVITASCFYTPGTASALPIPTRSGYRFDGWYSDAALTQKVDSIAATASESITLYAAWTQYATSVEYDLDGGVFPAGANKPDSVEWGQTSFKVSSPTKQNYIFLGWLVGDSTVPVKDVIPFTASSSVDSIKLTAKWQVNVAYLEYDLGGGEFANTYDHPDVKVVGTTSLALPKLKDRDNLVFKGWLINGSGSPMTGTVAYVVTAGETIRLTAVWERSRGAVTFVVPSYATLSGEYTQTFPLGVESDLVFPTVSGVEFEGWYLTADYSGEPIESYRISANDGELIFYGKCTRVMFDSTFNTAQDPMPSQAFVSEVDPSKYGVELDLESGSLHWIVAANEGDKPCRSDLKINAIATESKTLVFELAIKGSVVSKNGDSNIRLRAGDTSHDTPIIRFGCNGDNSVSIGKQWHLGMLSETEMSSIAVVITFVEGGVSVDGYFNGELVVDDAFIETALGPIDESTATVDCTRLNWYVGNNSVFDVYLDYLYLSNGSELKYMKLSES